MEFSEKELSELGFEVIKDLNEREKRHVSNFIANKLTDQYLYLKIGYFDIFSILYNTPMYFSKNPENMSSVNYLYQNLSLYFAENKDVFDIDEFIIHEGIHKIQDKRNKSGKLMRLGLCEFTDTKVKGLAWNEAAVQYIVSTLLEKEKKDIKTYNISLKTISDSYYPLITNLIEQIVLLIGDKKLVQSTILANNDFNYEVIDYLGEHNFNAIIENFDKIVELKKLINEENRDEIVKQINDVYFETQKIIYTNYFDKIIARINKIDEIKTIRQQLYEYAKLIFSSEQFDEFKAFYNEKVIALKELEININAKYALSVTSNNIFYRFFLKIKRLFYKGIIDESIK